jgi:hypothetical protein
MTGDGMDAAMVSGGLILIESAGLFNILSLLLLPGNKLLIRLDGTNSSIEGNS